MSELISFDYAIKYLLKDKGDHEIVEGFISALLTSQGYKPVKITALLESESNREERDNKRSIADLVVEDDQGNKYIVEIDKAYTKFFLHKACFNSSRLIVDSISQGEDYSSIKKIFHISLIYFPFSNMKSPLYHGKTIIREVDTEHPLDIRLSDLKGKTFDSYNLFPEYFIISVPLFDNVIKTEMDEWLYLMRNSDVKEEFKSPYMKKVAERLNILKMSPEERKTYNEYRNKSLKERDVIISAEEKGEARGIAKGMAEGMAKGKAEGMAKGKAELINNMLKKGCSVEMISELTGIPKEEIEKLIND